MPDEVKHAHPEHFSASEVRVETRWLGDRRTDAELVLNTRSEKLAFHAYHNRSETFGMIIDMLGAGSGQKPYDVRMEVKPPVEPRGEWGREAASEILTNPETKFSFRYGVPNGYGTIYATFYAYQKGSERNGSIVSLTFIISKQTTTSAVPAELLKKRF